MSEPRDGEFRVLVGTGPRHVKLTSLNDSGEEYGHAQDVVLYSYQLLLKWDAKEKLWVSKAGNKYRESAVNP